MAGKLVIVSEAGCPACKVWKPIIAQVRKRHPCVDVEYVPASSKEPWVQAIQMFPTVIVLRDGKPVKQIYGAYGIEQTERIFQMAEGKR